MRYCLATKLSDPLGKSRRFCCVFYLYSNTSSTLYLFHTEMMMQRVYREFFNTVILNAPLLGTTGTLLEFRAWLPCGEGEVLRNEW